MTQEKPQKGLNAASKKTSIKDQTPSSILGPEEKEAPAPKRYIRTKSSSGHCLDKTNDAQEQANQDLVKTMLTQKNIVERQSVHDDSAS